MLTGPCVGGVGVGGVAGGLACVWQARACLWCGRPSVSRPGRQSRSPHPHPRQAMLGSQELVPPSLTLQAVIGSEVQVHPAATIKAVPRRMLVTDVKLLDPWEQAKEQLDKGK